ncbi:MAG: glucose-1-phosphate adenylyltransferase [Synergistaceae bacterium]|nr:glucose-1-phosphate adenylyltransferase [Synergistaceae bacterium]
MKRECVAMILADGHGSELSELMKGPCFYGGGHRIIDFALSNCSYSGFDVVGIPARPSCVGLRSYIGNGRPWNLSERDGGIFVLPCGEGREHGGAVDAISRNIGFLERFTPCHVCVLSGTHVYRMDYSRMLDAHKRNDADVTIASVPESYPEARGHDAVSADENGAIFDFQEKSRGVRSSLASMGVYIFRWSVLRKYLSADRPGGRGRDFGRDVVPAMLRAGKKLCAYRFGGYWRDVETVEDLWKFNMDILRDPAEFLFRDETREVLGVSDTAPFRFIDESPTVRRSLLYGLHAIHGRVEGSVLSDSVVVEKGAEVVDSVLMPNVYIGKNAKISKAVIACNSRLMEGVEIGAENGLPDFVSDRFRSGGVSLVAPWVRITRGTKLQKNSYVESDVFGGRRYAGRWNQNPDARNPVGNGPHAQPAFADFLRPVR